MIAKIYVAYDLYDEDKKKIKNLFFDKLKEYDYDIIFHETEYLHSTVAFIGETEIENAVRMKEQLKKIDINNVNIKIDGKLMILGSGNKYYLTLKIKNNDVLVDIYNQVIEGLNTVGLKAKNTEYLPHISLGKVVPNTKIKEENISTDVAMEVKPKSLTIFRSVDYSKEI